MAHLVSNINILRGAQQTLTGQPCSEIKKLVTFSPYDMLDKKHCVPPESVFGNFDLVLCRNLLIYFNTEYQETIFEKLYHSLAKNGILILGEAEAPVMNSTFAHV